jgi:prepilin-type N-terminal cleavage/methylation domain-containing protein
MNMIKNILFILLSCQKKFRLSPGFTLLEVLVAIAILGVSLITLFELFSGGLRLGRASEDYLKATLFAQKKMNELRLANFTLGEGEEAGVFEEDQNYRWSATVEPFDRELEPETEGIEKETKGGEDEAAGEETKIRKPMQKVELKVSWKSGGKPKELSLVRLVNPIKWNYQDYESAKPEEKNAETTGPETGQEKK